MSNIFSIASADIRDIVANESAYQDLITDARYGGSIEPQPVIDRGVAKFVGWCHGSFTAAANLAIARPFAVDCALHALHALKAASNPGYIIPQTVIDDRDKAEEWAGDTGVKLLGAEGNGVPGEGAIEYTAPDSNYSMDQLDDL